jgi:hypothetical protein
MRFFNKVANERGNETNKMDLEKKMVEEAATIMNIDSQEESPQ